jgi:hypothetical protein
MDGHLKERIRVGTVDAFQGKEFDVVFLSMTRSNDLPITDNRSLRRKLVTLMLENRLCVAMSRQQRLLIVVGDSGMLRGEVAEQSLAGLVAFRKLCEGRHGLHCFSLIRRSCTSAPACQRESGTANASSFCGLR